MYYTIGKQRMKNRIPDMNLEEIFVLMTVADQHSAVNNDVDTTAQGGVKVEQVNEDKFV